MKLSHVLLLIIFSSILSVGFVIDISFATSQYDEDMPYEAFVKGTRSGGEQDRLHVHMYARASSTDRARNGTLLIAFYLDNGWSDEPPAVQVNRHYWHKKSHPLQFEESGGEVYASAAGGSTSASVQHIAQAQVVVPPMPPLEPTEGTPTEPEVGISATDSDDTVTTGETHEYKLITETPYYWVDWYVKTPWDTSESERGTYITYEYGDGTKTESTFSYSFPSGSMHTGNFLITAVIWRWSDMFEYEETYTESVSLE